MKENIRILIVDDEESIRRYIVKLLTQGGYYVSAVSSGKEALREREAGRAEFSHGDPRHSHARHGRLETLGEIRKISKEPAYPHALGGSARPTSS
jgi:CheY-like chemotaxis protein